MIIYKGTIGITKQFQCVYPDGSARPLTGLSANLKLEDRDGNVLSKALDITDESEGQCELVITSDITASVRTWTASIVPIDGSTVLEPSDPFYIDILDTPNG